MSTHDEATEVRTDQEPDALAYYGSQLMVARDQQGRLAEIVELIADLADQNPGMPVYKAVLTWAHLEAGDEPTARQQFNVAADGGFDLPQDSIWIDGMMCYASVAAQLRLIGPAEDLLAKLAPYHDQVACQGVTFRETVATYVGGLASILERYDEAERHFAAADALTVRGGMAYARALNDLWWGRMLESRGAGHREQADLRLGRARSAAHAHGYALVEKRASALLRQ